MKTMEKRRTVIIEAIGVTTGRWYEAERISGLTMNQAIMHARRAYKEYDEDAVKVTIL